jgi:hypothetical protein
MVATKHFSCQYFWAESLGGHHAIFDKDISWKMSNDHQTFFLPIFLGQIA